MPTRPPAPWRGAHGPARAHPWRGLALGLGLVLAGGAAPARADRALLIGIDDYHVVDPNPSPDCRQPCLVVGPLYGTVADVQRVRSYLIDTLGYQPQEIRTLLNDEATAANIMAGIRDWLVAGTKPGDRAFLQYSGHGSQVPDLDGDEEDHYDEAIVPSDVRVDASGQVTGMLIDDQLEAALAGLDGRILTALFDSCHSGTVTREFARRPAGAGPEDQPRTPYALNARLRQARPVATLAELKTRVREPSLVGPHPGWTIWTAASANQPAWDQTSPAGGFFTGRLLAALSAPGALETSHTRLLDQLQLASRAYCADNVHCQGLVPTLETAWGDQPLARSLLNRAPAPAAAMPLVGATIAAAPVAPSPTMPAPTPAPDAVYTVAEPTPDPVAIASIALPPTGAAGQADLPPVVVDILPGRSPRIGDTVSFRIDAPLAGELLVLDANANGELVQIYPNRFSKGRAIGAHRPMTIPAFDYGFDFKAVAPAGRARLIALVTDGQVDLSDIATVQQGLVPVAAPRDYLAEIAARLRRATVVEADGTVRLARWSVGTVDYDIRPPGP